MKKFLEDKKTPLFALVIIIFVWRICLFFVETLASFLLTEREKFMGPISLANFDGIHYLLIAERGYGLHQEAFFPLFPFLISLLAHVLGENYLIASILVVYLSLTISLFLFWRLVSVDFQKKISRWSIAFLLLFPTAFFLGSIYTESFFLLLVFGSFYAARRGNWWLAGLLGGLASATRMVGIFLLPALLLEFYLQRYQGKKLEVRWIDIKKVAGVFLVPTGLASFIVYLQNTVGDPLAFVHAQTAFGANRSGNEIILLPQVIYRYIKILITVPLTNYDYWIALLEIMSFLAAFFILILNIQRIRLSYFVFSILSILTPTFTGTLSSMPRYILAAFPIFMVLSLIRSNRTKILLLGISSIFLILFTLLFAKGYFVA